MLSLPLSLQFVALATSLASPVEPPAPLWVFFDARPRAGAVEVDDTALTDRALARRAAHRNLQSRKLGPLDRDVPLVNERDLPVTETHLAALRAGGLHIRTTSRWLNAASVEATPAQAQMVRGLPFVRAIQPVRTAVADRPHGDGAPLFLDGGVADESAYALAQPQLAQMDLLALHARGFTGSGIVIGILDTGFNRVHAAFNDASHPLQVIAEHDFINDDPDTGIERGDPDGQHRHGTWILGTIGAYEPGTFLGAAYDAAFVLAKTEVVSSETQIEEDYYVAGLEFIEANGADLATSSLGYFDWYTQADFDGQTAVTTVAVNIATSNGLVCLTSAGNGGHDEDPATSHLGAPADAFDVLSCGEVDSTGVIAGFSSDGPTADGRIKPEILAWGVSTATVRSTDPTGYTEVSGTSLSTPLVAGAVACLLQARRDFDVSTLRSALFATATDTLAGTAPDPLFVRGYGIVQANGASLHGLSPADLDLDGQVDGADLGLMLGAWGPCTDCNACVGDLDGDCAVTGSDLGTLLAAWG